MPVAPEHAAGGPVYFAWVDAGETTFDPQVHARYDDYIFRLNIHLEEGQLPRASLTMKNPGALLATGRKQWVWIAFLVDGEIVPKFFGRVVAVPGAINQRKVTVEFIAKPADFLARKQAAAADLIGTRYHDPVFVDDRYADDPQAALKALPADWHHDPVDHSVTISDKLVGEDGVKDFPAGKVIYGSLDWSIGDPPKQAVRVEATVTWDQQATGTIALPRATFAGPIAGGVMNDWPKTGATFEGGWSVASASAIDLANVDKVQTKTFTYSWQNKEKEHANGDTMSLNTSLTTIAGPFGRPVLTGREPLIDYKWQQSFQVGDPETGQAASASSQWSGIHVLSYRIVADLTLGYAARRARTERLTFTLAAALQDVVTDAGGSDDIETLTLEGGDVGRLIDEGATSGPAMPIGDLARRDYFSTDRGRQSVEYALNVARADLLSNCRSVDVTFTTPFTAAIDVSCRMNGLVHDPSLPNGQALGKVFSVDLDADGGQGLFSAAIRLACAVGTDAAVVEVGGEPTYADADVLGPDVQVFAGRYVALPSADLVYSPPVDDVNDDGLVFPLTREQAVVRYETMSLGDQAATLGSLLSRIGGGNGAGNAWRSVEEQAEDQASGASRIQAAFDVQTALWQELELKPLDRPFEAEHAIVAGPLSVPQQVSLA